MAPGTWIMASGTSNLAYLFSRENLDMAALIMGI
jgi:hypothetical protein